jgi:putative transposase
MRLCNLAIDDEFILNGVKFYVHDIKAPNISFYREDGDKKIREKNYMELISDPSFQIPKDRSAQYLVKENNLEKKVSYKIDTLTKERYEKTMLRLKWIKPVLLYNQVKQGDLYANNSFNELYKEYLKKNEKVDDLTKTELLEKVEKKWGISKRQLQRYLKEYNEYEQYRENHGVEGLISKAHLNLHTRNDEKAIEICHPKKEEIILDVIYSRLEYEYLPLIKQALKKFLSK